MLVNGRLILGGKMNLYFLYIVEVWQICENINIKDPIGKSEEKPR